MPTFVLSDESVNRYGFRVLTSGIQLDRFKKNPVMFFNHEAYTMPIGRWENIRVKGSQLLADPIFDQADEQSVKIKAKVDEGFLSAASIGIRVLETSEEKEHLLPEQRRHTVIRSEIFEASITPIPANANALKLSFPSKGIILSGDFNEAFLSDTLPSIQDFSIQLSIDMKEIAVLLGLGSDATEAQVVEKIKDLQLSFSTQQVKSVAALIELGMAKGIITEQNKVSYEALAKADFEATLSLVKDAPEKEKKEEEGKGKGSSEVRLSTILEAIKGSGNQDNDPRSSWTIRDWETKDPNALLSIKRTEPKKYQKLYDAYYKTALA